MSQPGCGRLIRSRCHLEPWMFPPVVRVAAVLRCVWSCCHVRRPARVAVNRGRGESLSGVEMKALVDQRPRLMGPSGWHVRRVPFTWLRICFVPVWGGLTWTLVRFFLRHIEVGDGSLE